MCWESKTCNIQIAKENIPVFKVVDNQAGKLYSYYLGFEYTLGVEYTQKLNIIKEKDLYAINVGFHSYSMKNAVTYEMVYEGERFIKVNSYPTNSPLDSFWRYSSVIADCIIPKGSRYCLNEKGEYVSDRIALINIRHD